MKHATTRWNMRSIRIGLMAIAGGIAFSFAAGYAQHKESEHKGTVAVYTADAEKEKFAGNIPASISLVDALTAENRNKTLCVAATVAEVCQKKGCWMILTDGERSVRVTFKDYAFFVPKDITGTTVLAQGVIEETVLSEADARHYAEDAGASEEEIEAIVGDQKELSMVAEVVFIKK